MLRLVLRSIPTCYRSSRRLFRVIVVVLADRLKINGVYQRRGLSFRLLSYSIPWNSRAWNIILLKAFLVGRGI